MAELLLYSADRAEHVSKIIAPRLKDENWVISDRFADSTAYQGYGRKINLNTIKNIESIVCQGESPDLTIFLEISPEESILRRKNEVPDRMESEGIKFLEKVNEGFKIIAKEKLKVISASQNIKTVSNQIKETLLKSFSYKKMIDLKIKYLQVHEEVNICLENVLKTNSFSNGYIFMVQKE